MTGALLKLVERGVTKSYGMSDDGDEVKGKAQTNLE
jgi:hypothetical protein